MASSDCGVNVGGHPRATQGQRGVKANLATEGGDGAPHQRGFLH